MCGCKDVYGYSVGVRMYVGLVNCTLFLHVLKV